MIASFLLLKPCYIMSQNDSIAKRKPTLQAKVDYQSKDSITFFLNTKDVHIYNEAKVDYEKMKLQSGFMTVNFDTKILFAEKTKDSLEKTNLQYPIFKEGTQEYNSKQIKYNFDTQCIYKRKRWLSSWRKSKKS